MMKANLDDIAAKLPQIEFRKKKKPTEYYNQKMQSLRGGRQFILRTSERFPDGAIRLTLTEYGTLNRDVVIGHRYAMFGDAGTIQKAIKSLERKAKCKVYYVLLISTDGDYL
jgi:hypothetical protein